MMKRLRIASGTLMLLLVPVWSTAQSPVAGTPDAEPLKADAAKSKPMNMDEPMAGGMKKEGMKKGDVKKAAKKKDHEMRKMIEKERQSAGAVKK